VVCHVISEDTHIKRWCAMVVQVQYRNVAKMLNDTLMFNLSHEDSTGSLLPIPGLSRTTHSLVAVCLGCILVLGSLYNSLVLLIFVRFDTIRTPINMILLNISVSDLLVCIFGTPFSFAASVSGGWLIGQQGCKWYGFCNSLFALHALCTQCTDQVTEILAFQYLKLPGAKEMNHINTRKTWKMCLRVWLKTVFYCLCLIFIRFQSWASFEWTGDGRRCLWSSPDMNVRVYLTVLALFCMMPLLNSPCYDTFIVSKMGEDGPLYLGQAQRQEEEKSGVLFAGVQEGVVSGERCFKKVKSRARLGVVSQKEAEGASADIREIDSMPAASLETMGLFTDVSAYVYCGMANGIYKEVIGAEHVVVLRSSLGDVDAVRFTEAGLGAYARIKRIVGRWQSLSSVLFRKVARLIPNENCTPGTQPQRDGVHLSD
ncbi:pinopsin-like isoform X1, partial [Pelobates cultripes]